MEDELLSLIRQRDKQNATLKHEINNLLNELKIKSDVPNNCASLRTLTNLSYKIASKILLCFHKPKKIISLIHNTLYKINKIFIKFFQINLVISKFNNTFVKELVQL